MTRNGKDFLASKIPVFSLTEDSSGKSGFYRYVPAVATGAPGSLAQGGQLSVPEPATYALLAAGLLLLGMSRRRR